jgi:hypothetical protein
MISRGIPSLIRLLSPVPSTSDSKLIDPSGKVAAIASNAAWLMAMRITNG